MGYSPWDYKKSNTTEQLNNNNVILADDPGLYFHKEFSHEETWMYRTDFWTLWEKARVGCFERTASKDVYYLR